MSPVLYSELVVTLENTYPGAMDSALDFEAPLNGVSDDTISRPLFVKSIDAVAKTVTIAFPGADSGDYQLALVGKGVGRIDKEALNLKVEGVVTGITPLTGSYLGGNKITITGQNFATNKLDNPVKLGNTWCYVESSKVDEIVCRVRESGETVDY